MTDKEIALELTKVVIEKQFDLTVVNEKGYAVATGDNAAALFNAIANGIKPTLDKLATQCDKQAHNS